MGLEDYIGLLASGLLLLDPSDTGAPKGPNIKTDPPALVLAHAL